MDPGAPMSFSSLSKKTTIMLVIGAFVLGIAVGWFGHRVGPVPPSTTERLHILESLGQSGSSTTPLSEEDRASILQSLSGKQ